MAKTWENFLPLRKQLISSELYVLLAAVALFTWGRYLAKSNLIKPLRESIDLSKRAAIDMLKVSITCIGVCAGVHLCAI